MARGLNRGAGWSRVPKAMKGAISPSRILTQETKQRERISKELPLRLLKAKDEENRKQMNSKAEYNSEPMEKTHKVFAVRE